MKILKFKYTKKIDDVSERVFIPLTQPAMLYSGIDVTNLEPELQAKVIQELAEVINERDLAIGAKIAEFGLGFKSFMPAKMDDIDISYKGNTCPELIAEKAPNLAGS